MVDLIGGIDATAPLWRNTPPDDLRAIVQLLSDASYHYADDSAGEWGAAGKALSAAAKAINAAKLGHYAITALRRDKPQLVTLEQLYDAILKDARK